MKRIIVVVVAGFLCAAPLAAVAETHTVETLDSNVFAPDPITIQVGDSIEFVNPGKLPHTATAEDGSWDTGNLGPGQRKTITFDRPGEIPYVCIYHESLGMVGTIIVEGAAAAPGAPAPQPTSQEPSEPTSEEQPVHAQPQVQSPTVVAGATQSRGAGPRIGPILFAGIGFLVALLLAGAAVGRRMKEAGH